MKLHFSSGEGNAMITKDLLPTTSKQRTLTVLGLIMIWAGMAIDFTSFATAMSFYPQMSPMSIIGAIFLGYILVAVICMFTGEVGLVYGIKFPVYARACFGYTGTHVPGLIRSLPCWFWAGFQTYVASYALNTVMYALTGFSSLWLMMILFTLLQVLNVALGINAMAKFDWLAVPFLGIVLAFIVGSLLNTYDTTILEVLRTEVVNDTGETIPFPAAVIAICGGWLCVAINFCDYTRQLKRDDDIYRQNFWKRISRPTLAAFVGLTCFASIITGLGLVAGPLTGSWNPVEYSTIAFEGNWFVLLICYLAILFAGWSTNTAANFLPAANVLSNLNPKLISYPIACLISGVISLAMQAWVYADSFYMVQLALAALIGPVCGILISDYYIVRRRKLNVPDLYRKDGQYSYMHNFNPASMITLLVTLPIGLFINQNYAFFIAFPLSIVLYWGLMKYWVIKKYPQIEITDPNYEPVFDYNGSDLGFDFSDED